MMAVMNLTVATIHIFITVYNLRVNMLAREIMIMKEIFASLASALLKDVNISVWKPQKDQLVTVSLV